MKLKYTRKTKGEKMTLKTPNSMDECLYFSNRTVGDGKVMAWVYRKECPKCHKAKMGKPVEKGKVKIRSDVYVCPACGYSEEKVAHEESCTLEAIYTCPKCKKQGESSAPYKRKKFMGTPAYIIECQHCGEKIPITKKLKDIKGKDEDAGLE
jgi:transcription elongation factor Elf1